MIADHFVFNVAVETILAQDTTQVADTAGNPTPLMVAGSVLLVIVLIGLPFLATKTASDGKTELKGLALPAGSVRSMLALMTVGVFVVVATFGGAALGSEYERVLTTLATLAGPVLGFYFGSRGSGGRSRKGTGDGSKAEGDPDVTEAEGTPPS